MKQFEQRSRWFSSLHLFDGPEDWLELYGLWPEHTVKAFVLTKLLFLLHRRWVDYMCEWTWLCRNSSSFICCISYFWANLIWYFLLVFWIILVCRLHNNLKDKLWMVGCWERDLSLFGWLLLLYMETNDSWYLINGKSMSIKLLRALSSYLKLAKILCQEFQFCIKQVVYSITRLFIQLSEIVVFGVLFWCCAWGGLFSYLHRCG